MSTPEDTEDLEGCNSDLVHMLKLAATWKGRDPTYVSDGLLDLMMGMLDLEFAYLRLDEAAHAFIRISPCLGPTPLAAEVAKTVSGWLETEPPSLPPSVSINEVSIALTALPLGITAGVGWLVVGSRRHDFPRPTEHLRLSVAASQATIAFREMRQISDRPLLPDSSRYETFGPKTSEAEHELRLFLDNIPTSAWCTAADGMAEYFNQSLLSYVGLTSEELKGLRFLSQFHPDDLPRLLHSWQQMLASKQGGEHEGRVRRADGEYRWTLMRTNPLLDGEGNVLRWYGINMDIEDRKRAEDSVRTAEAALAASQRNLALIIDSLPVLIWSSGADGQADYVNQQYLDYVGLKQTDILGWGYLGVIHPDDADDFAERWKEQLPLDYAVNAARYRRYDGEYRWFYVAGRKFTDANGTVRWFGVSLDIEDLKQTEGALRDSQAAVEKVERNLRQMINAIPGLVWSADVDGNPTFINRHYLEYIGLTEEEALGSGWSRAIHPDDLQSVLTTWDRMIKSGRGGDVEARLRGRDGTYRRFMFRSNPLYDDDRNLIQWFGVNFDIEDRRRAEEKWRQSQAELTHVARMMTMGELAVSIAHEVNQPLMAIVTNAGTCLRWLEDGNLNLVEARQVAQRIVKDGHRAGEIIASIRALAKKSPPRMEILGLEQAIVEVLDLIRGELHRSGIEPILSFAERGVEVLGDRTQLQQVILNLAMNSAEAITESARRSGRLVIQTSSLNDEHALVSISDNGRGLDPATTDRLFDAFFTTKSGGIGMGLSICRSIIEAHGGQIWASQNEPEGSVFNFTVPLAVGEDLGEQGYQ